MPKKQDNDFELQNLPEECRDPEITQEDFVLSETNEGVHEQRFVTKPTTFLKDSLRRFAKNKSSVVAAYILGALVLLSLIVPLCTDSEARTPFNTRLGPENKVYYMNLEPRLFTDAGGFWDGTVQKKHVPINAQTGLPDPIYYQESGITNMSEPQIEYTNSANKFGFDGYFEIGYYGQYADNCELSSTEFSEAKLILSGSDEGIPFVLDLSTTNLTLAKFESVDAAKIKAYEENDEFDIPENTVLGNVGLNFVYTVKVIETVIEDEQEVQKEVEKEGTVVLAEPKVLQDIGVEGGSQSISLNEKILEALQADGYQETTISSGNFVLTVDAAENTPENANVISLIKSLEFSVNDDAPEAAKKYFLENNGGDIPGISFSNAMEMASRTSTMADLSGTPKNNGYWTIPNLQQYMKSVYLGKSKFADFTYNTYEGALGKRDYLIPYVTLEKLQDDGVIIFDITTRRTDEGYEVKEFAFEVLNEDESPFAEDITAENVVNIDKVGGKIIFNLQCKVYMYRMLGMKEMPTFLFGTDKTGRDMLKYTFEGLRNSLALGLATFVICFVFGLIWGSVSGYFGGTVDLVMERITDILSGLPWIVAMTLIVLKTNSRSFGTFLFALCITGWIGTASRTRTQFYRFRGREYVLASRTLGASDARLIAKHILPNSLGTIITGAVLMIPSVIFSEATISYLGLGFQDLASLGVILSNNQDELTSHPYQLIFPSIIIALLMISFNLFGNGLRDAINPSLKGEEE